MTNDRGRGGHGGHGGGQRIGVTTEYYRCGMCGGRGRVQILSDPHGGPPPNGEMRYARCSMCGGLGRLREPDYSLTT